MVSMLSSNWLKTSLETEGEVLVVVGVNAGKGARTGVIKRGSGRLEWEESFRG